MPLNTELLNCTRLTAGMFFPNRQFQAGELNKLYGTVTEQYPYGTLQHLPDGIRMANQDNDCIVQGGQLPNAGRLQVNEGNIFHFEPARQKTVHLFSIVAQELKLTQYLAFGVKLTAFMPTENRTASELLEANLLKSAVPLLDQLGEGRQGCGIRMVLQRNGAHDLKIEPFYSDLSKLFIELDVQHPEPFTDLNSLDAKMSSAYRFLNEDVRYMLSQFS